ncbi:MAG: hypothetical protein HYR56_33905 [Acidobacteria bacterium]|nr:hypothetical protein [Acidobacteriota bacterium]MBI3427555.1 hypothetical protein [Acidobacteriota bacterium]
MEPNLIQSEKAKALVSGLESQFEGKGRYGNRDHEPFISNYVAEFAERNGISTAEATRLTRELISEFECFRITGKENPIYFSKCCQIASKALSLLSGNNLDLPNYVSVGLVERHEITSLALPSLDPPLLLFSSGQFELIGDIAFLCANPILRAAQQGLLIGVTGLDEEEATLLSEIVAYHALSSQSFSSSNGQSIFIEDRHIDPPVLQARVSGDSHRKHFLNLFHSGKEELYNFVIAHEVAHTSTQAKDFAGNSAREPQELFCDRVAIWYAITQTLNSSAQMQDHPRMVYAKLMMLLSYIQISTFVEMAKIAERKGIGALDVSSSKRHSEYPSFQVRMNSAKATLFEFMSDMFGPSAEQNVEALWNEVGGQNGEAFRAMAPEIDSHLKRVYDPCAMVEFLREQHYDDGTSQGS